MDIQQIRVDYIAIKGVRRPVRDEAVSKISESMKKIGLRTPITVRFVDNFIDTDGEIVDGQPVLVAGAHRLEAAKSLGWKKIDAFVFNSDSEIDADLWEISENLHRAGLSALEESEQIARWVELTEAKLAEARERVVSAQLAPKLSSRGRVKEGRPEGGLRAATRELGVDRRKAHRAQKIASIAPEAKDCAVEAGISDNQSALLRVAAATDQVAEVKKIAAEKATPRAAVQPEEVDQEVTPEECNLIRGLSDSDMVTLISEIDDNGWQTARRTLKALTIAELVDRAKDF